MQFIGYYPGVDFTDPSQFGRSAHTKSFINSYCDDIKGDPLFIIGDSGDYDSDHVSDLPNGSTKIFKDVCGFFFLMYFIIAADEDIVLYCRNSPYISKFVWGLHPSICYVTEVNGIASEESQNINLQSAMLESVRKKERKLSDLIIAVSPNIESHLVESEGLDNVEVVENGVDCELFSPNDTDTDDGINITYVGGLQEWQGIKWMLRVIEQMGEDVEISIVGGTQERMTELKAVAVDLGIGTKVNFIGRVEQDKVPKYINKSDICFGPFNKQRTASPMKIYEYLACGKHVVLINDSGLEYLDHIPGVHRFTSDTDEETIHEFILELESYDNPKGRDYILKNRSWSAVVENIYNRIINHCYK